MRSKGSQLEITQQLRILLNRRKSETVEEISLCQAIVPAAAERQDRQALLRKGVKHEKMDGVQEKVVE